MAGRGWGRGRGGPAGAWGRRLTRGRGGRGGRAVRARAGAGAGWGGAPLEAVRGGPVRLLVPHLYLWKSAKWLRGIAVTQHDELGFWERPRYHPHRAPSRAQPGARGR